MALNGRGQRQEAADTLLDIIKADRSWNEDGARLQLLKFFDEWGFADPASAAYAARSLGRKLVHRKHRTISPPTPPPLLFPRDESAPRPEESYVLVPTHEPVLSAEQLALLPPGEIRLRFRAGQVKTLHTDIAAD